MDLKHLIKNTPVYSRWRAWDFTEEAGLILAGGGQPYSTIVEQSTDRGKTFQQIQTMPYGGNGNAWTARRVVGACMVIIDATTVFIAGGYHGRCHSNFRIHPKPAPNIICFWCIAGRNSFCDTWFLDLTDNTWTQGPDMTTCRHHQTCTLLEDTNEIVIIAGGTKATNTSCKTQYQNSVEVLDLSTKTFRSGKRTILGCSILIRAIILSTIHCRHWLSVCGASSCTSALRGLISCDGRLRMRPFQLQWLYLQKMQQIQRNLQVRYWLWLQTFSPLSFWTWRYGSV